MWWQLLLGVGVEESARNPQPLGKVCELGGVGENHAIVIWDLKPTEVGGDDCFALQLWFTGGMGVGTRPSLQAYLFISLVF